MATKQGMDNPQEVIMSQNVWVSTAPMQTYRYWTKSDSVGVILTFW